MSMKCNTKFIFKSTGPWEINGLAHFLFALMINDHLVICNLVQNGKLVSIYRYMPYIKYIPYGVHKEHNEEKKC